MSGLPTPGMARVGPAGPDGSAGPAAPTGLSAGGAASEDRYSEPNGAGPPDGAAPLGGPLRNGELQGGPARSDPSGNNLPRPVPDVSKPDNGVLGVNGVHKGAVPGEGPRSDLIGSESVLGTMKPEVSLGGFPVEKPRLSPERDRDPPVDPMDDS